MLIFELLQCECPSAKFKYISFPLRIAENYSSVYTKVCATKLNAVRT